MIICGLAGGFINTVAASGATVVVPSMIGLGLEAGMANGTSRLAAVAGLATATWRFHQAGAILAAHTESHRADGGWSDRRVPLGHRPQ